MSADIQWAILRKFSSQVYNSKGSRVNFSSSPKNVANLHRRQFIPLLNHSALSVTARGDSDIAVHIKKSHGKRTPSKSSTSIALKAHKGSRKVLRTVRGLSKVQPAVAKFALARASRLLAAQKRRVAASKVKTAK